MFIWCLFICFFFLPPDIEGLRVCKQLVQHSLFTTGKARLLASDLLLLRRHILGRLGRLASASWGQQHALSATNPGNMGAESELQRHPGTPCPRSKISAASPPIPRAIPSSPLPFVLMDNQLFFSFNFIGSVIENICKYQTWKREIQHEARRLQSAYSNYELKFTEVWGLVNFRRLLWGCSLLSLF